VLLLFEIIGEYCTAKALHEHFLLWNLLSSPDAKPKLTSKAYSPGKSSLYISNTTDISEVKVSDP